MGTIFCINKDQKNRIHFQNQNDVARTIREISQLSDQQILSFFISYIQYETQKYYLEKLQPFLQAKREFESKNIPQSRNNEGDSKFFYHMEQISNIVKFVFHTFSEVEKESKNLKQSIERNHAQWKNDLHMRLKIQNEKKKPQNYYEMKESSVSYSGSGKSFFNQKQENQKKEERMQRRSKMMSQAESNELSKKEAIDLFNTSSLRLEEEIEKKNNLIIMLNDKLANYSRESESKISELEEEKVKNIFTITQYEIKIAQLEKQLVERSEKRVVKISRLNSSQKTSQFSYIERQIEEIQTIFKPFTLSPILYSEDLKSMKEYRRVVSNLFLRTISNTEMIYTFDGIQKNNLFHYLKRSHKNLLLLMRLQNGVICGGFSSQSFVMSEQELEENDCFIFSIRPDSRVVKLIPKKDKRGNSVKLDQSYLKFGVNEVRIKCGSNECYTNIGSNFSTFYSPNEEVSYQGFFNINKKEFKVEKYEVHQIKFEQ